MHRARLIPPAPKEIQGRAFDIECISTLADAQKSTATTGIERLVAFVGNLAAAKPEALDNVDFDETVREYADSWEPARSSSWRRTKCEGEGCAGAGRPAATGHADVDGGCSRGENLE